MASGEKMKIERNHFLRVAFVGWGCPGGDYRVETGAIHMHTPDADYFRHQAATCLRLAQFCRDLEVARRLFGMAGEFKSKAAEMDAGLQTMTVPSIEPSCGPARD